MSSDGHWLVQGIPRNVSYNVAGPNNTGEAIVYNRQFLNDSVWDRKYLLKPQNGHLGMLLAFSSRKLFKHICLIDKNVILL